MTTPEPYCTIHLRIRVADGKREEFLTFLREAIPFYERHGDSYMRLLEDPRDPHRFIEVVEYHTEAAYQRGEEEVENDPEMQGYLERWREHLAEPPQVEYWMGATQLVRD